MNNEGDGLTSPPDVQPQQHQGDPGNQGVVLISDHTTGQEIVGIKVPGQHGYQYQVIAGPCRPR